MQFFEDAKPEPWTPPSLHDLPEPPVFQLRPPRHGARDLRYEIMAAGLHFHPDAAIRQEAIRGLRALWSPDEADENIKRVEGLWAAMDRGEELTADDAAALDELSVRLRRAWPPIAEMAADNAEFVETVPALAVSLAAAGWSGSLNVPYGRERGRVPLEKVEAMAKALAGVEQAAGLQPGVAFVELSARAFAVVNGTATDEPAADPVPIPSPETPAATEEPKPARRRASKGPENA